MSKAKKDSKAVAAPIRASRPAGSCLLETQTVGPSAAADVSKGVGKMVRSYGKDGKDEKDEKDEKDGIMRRMGLGFPAARGKPTP